MYFLESQVMTILHFLLPIFLSIGLLGCGQSSGPSVNTPPQPAAPAGEPVVKIEVGLVHGEFVLAWKECRDSS